MNPDDFASLLRQEARLIDSAYPQDPPRRIRVGKKRDNPQRQRTHFASYNRGSRDLDIYQTHEPRLVREALKTFYHEYGHCLHFGSGEDGDPLGVVDKKIVDFYDEKGWERNIDNIRWCEDVAVSFAVKQMNRRWIEICAEYGTDDMDEVSIDGFVRSIRL